MKKIVAFLYFFLITTVIGCSKSNDVDVVTPDIFMSEQELFLAVDGSAKILITFDPADTPNQGFSWSSSNPAVVDVSPPQEGYGYIVALSEGTAIITAVATDGGKSVTCKVTVVGSIVPVSSISLVPNDLTLVVGESSTLEATILPSNATDKRLTWRSYSSSIASVSSSGRVTALARGISIIAATSSDGGAVGSSIITVVEQGGGVIYVSGVYGDDSNDGDSWSSSYRTIEKAINSASSGSQIWIDNGTYQEHINVKEGVDIYGGFIGTESELSERPEDGRTTLLRKTIVQSSDFSQQTVVDGFTLSTLDSSFETELKGNLKLSNSTITGCSSHKFVVNGSVVDGCEYSSNSNGELEIINSGLLSNSVVKENTNTITSGRDIITSTGATIKNCTISNNTLYTATASTKHYMMEVHYGSLIQGCMISNNRVITTSSSLYASDTSTLVIIRDDSNIYNCSFVENKTTFTYQQSGNYSRYGAILSLFKSSAAVNVVNCLFWNPESFGYGSSYIGEGEVASTSYGYFANCAVLNNSVGVNPITLTNSDGAIPPRLNSDYSLQATSPLIDAGNNSFVDIYYTTDIAGNSRIKGGYVDIGAYEY